MGTLHDGEDKDRALLSVISSWVESDPTSAARYVESVQGELREKAIRQLAMGWCQHDPAAAAAWIIRLNDDGAKMSYKLIADLWVRSDPPAAVQWAGTIPDVALRNDILFTLFSRWMAKDAAGATPAIQKSSLPQEMKDRLLRPLMGR